MSDVDCLPVSIYHDLEKGQNHATSLVRIRKRCIKIAAQRKVPKGGAEARKARKIIIHPQNNQK